MPLLSADGMWLPPQWDAESPPARGSHPQYSSHCSICCLLREQTGFRSHVLNGLIKTIAVALEENCHVLVQNHRLTASLLFTCLQCHSQDPSCFWAAKAKKKKRRFANLRTKSRNRGWSSQVPQLVREHEQVYCLPKGSDRWGKRRLLLGTAITLSSSCRSTSYCPPGFCCSGTANWAVRLWMLDHPQLFAATFAQAPEMAITSVTTVRTQRKRQPQCARELCKHSAAEWGI